MDPTTQDKRQPIPSILTVYRPIEEYCESFGPSGDIGPDPEEALAPFDAFLVHRVLDLVPGLPVLIDTALAATGGASSLIGLNHPHVRGVVAVLDRESLVAQRALAAVRSYVRHRGSALAPLEVVGQAEMPGGLAAPERAVILVDARSADPEDLAQDLGAWLDELGDALVLVLGLGRVGSCSAIESLVRLCGPGTDRRFWLMRELGDVLAASDLGVVARHDHPHVADLLHRVQQFYTGNYGFLDLFRQVNETALRDAQIDAEVLRTHPLSWALTAEIDELKRTAREAKEHAAATAHALAVRTEELEELRRALHEAREELRGVPAVVAPASVVTRVRRKLARTPLGKAWRLAKRIVRKGLSMLRA